MMHKAAAYFIAMDAIAGQHKLEFVYVDGKKRMVPADRLDNGAARLPSDQEAADAYNWLQDHKTESQFR